MKLPLLLSIVVMLTCCNNNQQGDHASGHKHDSASSTASKDTSKKSLPAETVQKIGNADITIKYHAPGVRNRVIWGGLVPYDEVWVTGAHNATTLEVNSDFEVANKSIKAGKYAIFTIPGKDEWIVIINSNWDQHLADEYSDKEDVVRVNVRPQMQQESTERLKYRIDPIGQDTANISIAWEKVRIEFPLVIRQ